MWLGFGVMLVMVLLAFLLVFAAWTFYDINRRENQTEQEYWARRHAKWDKERDKRSRRYDREWNKMVKAKQREYKRRKN